MKILLLMVLFIATPSYALTGKKEFIIQTDDRLIRIIHYFDKMIVLSEGKRANNMHATKTCDVFDLNGNKFIGEGKEIYFFDDQAYVKSEAGLNKYDYVKKKTEMIFYKDLCQLN